ncbi:MAG: DUF4920 domain-containing protein [Weeksellaceae bacterium]|nr:DUF4920 domain-containing protein [Weeksellaceae bacterium]
MKNALLALLFSSIAFGLQSCQQDASNTTATHTADAEYTSFGEQITPDGAITQAEMLEKYNTIQPGDTLQLKFVSEVTEVCQAKGCWMKLKLDPETTATVKFKDYDFFVPKNAAGSEAIVQGKAFRTVQSVEERKHLAADAGKSAEEIAAITEPRNTLNFEAEGVLLR